MNHNFRNCIRDGLLAILTLSIVSVSCSEYEKEPISPKEYNDLVSNFKSPADSVKPWCYYYWIGDDISKEGVTKDLMAMKEVGIGAALIGNINPEEVDGKVPLFSEEWWEIMVHAVTEGKRLGVDIGVFNCPGWSQSGGPWVSSDMAMRYMVYSETKIKGGQEIVTKLARPSEEFQDTYVLAFPSILAEEKNLTSKNSEIQITPSIKNATNLIDGEVTTEAGFSKSVENYQVDLKTKKTITARSLKIIPSQDAFKVDCEVLAETNGSYSVIRSFTIDRSKLSPNVGADKYAPILVALPETESKSFRIKFKALGGVFQSNTYPNAKIPAWNISEIVISESAGLEDFAEKNLGKMHPTPFPSWDSYLWKQQQDIQNKDLKVALDKVVDLSDKMDTDGTLKWNAPAGEWTIQRFGMTPTGTKNAPAAPQGKGYEIDKMSEKLVRFHFENFVGELLNRIPEESKSAFKYVIGDSYEMGSQNWSDDFQQKFQSKYGYDPKPFLPTYTGRVVESVEASDRFLWDMRRLVADEVAYQYVGGLKKVSNENNLKMWLENYGHWGFPSEFLMYGGQSDLVSGEFWNEGSLGNIECKASSSAAHIYGKPVTSAEAFTAAHKSYLRHPALLKKRGDWSFTEGINHFVLHLYIHQPDDNRKPGVNAWFSTEFNRHNTWFKQSKTWIDYLRRCQVLLQHGQYVADVCYFIGEDTPIMTGQRNPELPNGYSYDYINAEVILNRLTVKDGRFVLPDGMSFGMMVLPALNTMRPEVLAKIEELVKAGGMIYGSKPIKSPSYANFPESDNQVKVMADRMWGETPSGENLNRKYGDGLVLNGMELQQALDFIQLPTDVALNTDDKVLFTHREIPGMDIYFLTNQSDKVLDIRPSFRVENARPQLWDAVTGEIRTLPEFEVRDGRITLPIHFEKDQSWFVVFTNAGEEVDGTFNKNFPQAKLLKTLDNGWSVDFKNKDIGPRESVEFPELTDWSLSENELIKYYSGAATYTSSFSIEEPSTDSTYHLDLGQVNVMAKVKVNGKDVGTTWMAPYRLNLGNSIIQGENKIEIEVVNLWRNQMLKDRALPVEQRYTWHLVDDMKDDEPLQVSGLLGPVTIEVIR
ncbi:MAG: glycosyl hydrolase [Cyclobacteriaceae bacterium]